MRLLPFTKTYQGKTVLDFPGMELPAGQVCAVIGANGGGKSTLAKIVSGALPPDGGGAVLDGPCRVGYMPQHSYPFRMTVRRNLLLNADGGADSRRRAEELLERLEIGHLADRQAHRLSGGETARMALARLLMRDYGLLVLDEPTAAMDIQSTALAEELVTQYRARTGCAVLWVTHSLGQARRVADSALFLYRGQAAEQGPAAKLLTDPETAQLRQFLEFYGA